MSSTIKKTITKKTSNDRKEYARNYYLNNKEKKKIYYDNYYKSNKTWILKNNLNNKAKLPSIFSKEIKKVVISFS